MNALAVAEHEYSYAVVTDDDVISQHDTLDEALDANEAFAGASRVLSLIDGEWLSDPKSASTIRVSLDGVEEWPLAPDVTMAPPRTTVQPPVRVRQPVTRPRSLHRPKKPTLVDDVRVNACQTNLKTPEDHAAFEGIVRAAVRLMRGDDEPAACRECGCTEDDSSGCIELTGAPCSWVEPDLCSACFSKTKPLPAISPVAKFVVVDGRGELVSEHDSVTDATAANTMSRMSGRRTLVIRVADNKPITVFRS